jgi:prevent-host-death family protein
LKLCQLKDAKARLSEFVSRVSEDGPFVITVHGEQKAALVPMDVYDRMFPQSREPLLDFFRRSPLRGVELRFERDKSTVRRVAL